MALYQVVITYTDRTTKTIKSGDREAWNTCTKEEKEWIVYLRNTERECNDRTLNVNGIHYKPTYKKPRKHRKTGK